MNFLSNVLDAIPVVGHVKGVVHYAVGDTEGGNQAMYQYTRTTALLAGGAAGSIAGPAGALAGPAGALAGAMSVSLATDTVASIVAMDKPQVFIEGVDNIGNDISAQKEREQNRKEREERERKNKEREREEKEKQGSEGNQQGSNQGSNSGAAGKKQNNKNDKNKEIFDAFMKLLKRLLKKIYGNENEPISAIFEGLSEGQITYLAGIIQVTINTGTLEEVVELVIRMFREHMSSNITFENFLSLIEFARAYLLYEIDSRQTESTRYTRGTPADRRAQILQDIMRERDVVERLVRLFRSLQAEIQAETAPPNQISPDFRDIFAAVYHYYKHMMVPGDGKLTVKQYYDWIRKILAELKKKARYRNEVENQRGPVTCRYEIYVVLFGRRFRVVVNVRRGCLVLSSAFVVTIQYVGDKEGDEILNIEKKIN